MPGFGAQGGSAAAALAGLKKVNGIWEGGLVNSTRGLIFPKTAASASTKSDWRAAIDAAISDSSSALAAVN